MKRNCSYSIMLTILRAVVILILLAGCATSEETTAQPVFEVTVSMGNGSGSYPAGSTVHIWADLNVPNQVFKEWGGDLQLITDPHSAHSTIQMPAHDVVFAARYSAAPDWIAIQETIAGRRVFYYIPKDAVGVITLFHGSGGDAAEWTETSVERRIFVDEAVAAGYGIVATESLDRKIKQWNMIDSLTDNPDIAAVRTILDTFITRGILTRKTPVFGIGMSQGARFVSLLALRLGFHAVGIHCGTSEEALMEVTTVPTVWCLTEHDLVINNRKQSIPLHKLLENRSIPTELYINPPAPLYPLRFARIPELTPDDSRKIFSELQANGFLDQDHYLKRNPRTSGWEKQVALDYPAGIKEAIREQLFVAFAEHEFFSDCDRKVLDFFNTQPK
jgi:hypothetical protein